MANPNRDSDPSAGSSQLQPPPQIEVHSDQTFSDSFLPSPSPLPGQTNSTTLTATPADWLTVSHDPPRSSHSLDGDTLRTRADSTVSGAETVANSEAPSILDPIKGKGFSRGLSDFDDVPLSEALNPDPHNLQDFDVQDNKFPFSPGQLNKMLNPKSLAAYHALGGVSGLGKALRTDLKAGLSDDERRLEGKVVYDAETSSFGYLETPSSSEGTDTQFYDRIRIFSQNRLPARKMAGFLKLLWMAYNDKIIILLTVAAIISLSLGIYQTIDEGHGVDWVEGVAIVVAIATVTIVTALNDWQKERQFAKLNKRVSSSIRPPKSKPNGTQNNDREVKAIRSGKVVMISIYDINVGDVLHLEPGDSVPADGVLISGHGIKCDESSATGESDQMKKTDGFEVSRQIAEGTATKKLDPFMISGSQVLEGVGTYLVTSVGKFSTYGRILMSLQESNDPTPLQVKLGKLANWIGWLGSGAAIILFFVLLFRFIANLPNNTGTAAAKGKEFVDILIVAVTVIVVAIPEGLPLAVTLALAFATTRMVKENNLVRILRACETMGNATVICSDKTGTLTQNKMTVVAGTLGSKSFGHSTGEGESTSMSAGELFKSCSHDARDVLVKSIALNSTAFEEEKDGSKEFIGSKTEVALLQLARDYLAMDVTTERASATVAQLIPFDSSRKCMGVVYRVSEGHYRLAVKGAAEIMVEKCSTRLNFDSDSVSIQAASTEDKQQSLDTVDSYAKRSLRTIGLVYKDFYAPSWPPVEAVRMPDDPESADFDSIFRDMTWLGVMGIQDPLRPEVPAAIQKCRGAGVQVKMVTGDNISTATAIAESCGIKTTGGTVMEGPKFRQLSEEEMDKVIPHLQVLARSSPEDKRILVSRLKKLGETVAVTGDGTNDGPALKAADVGFSMGIAGTEVAKEASSIILLDDNFKSIVTAISWGRAVNDAVAKFLQFQITVNITAVILTFVSSLYSSDNQSVLSAVQLLWVNLIMDTFAALALATDAPTEKILDRKPVPKGASLFTVTMWKMILGQAIYQLVITFMLFFAGDRILSGHLDPRPDIAQRQLDTIVFNTFVWMQIFNEFNNRRLDNKLNIFEGMHRNFWFIGINCIMVGGQIMIIYVGGEAFTVRELNAMQWGVCIALAIGCLPWAVALRFIPDKPVGLVLDAVITCIGFVMKPVGRALAAIGRPVKRLMRRRESKGEDADDSDAKSLDEYSTEQRISDEEQRTAVPQVMITTPDNASTR
ncbi:putative calcium-translocating P-type ATPase(PMCA-type) [Aspergillus lucknowensis]|uniref:Calcium-transporting ATPase n=1 Tax=Aspergillus lucknowensis TaxID=176173 RepID=A0ABR4LV40_9EURO